MCWINQLSPLIANKKKKKWLSPKIWATGRYGILRLTRRYYLDIINRHLNSQSWRLPLKRLSLRISALLRNNLSFSKNDQIRGLLSKKTGLVSAAKKLNNNPTVMNHKCLSGNQPFLGNPRGAPKVRVQRKMLQLLINRQNCAKKRR